MRSTVLAAGAEFTECATIEVEDTGTDTRLRCYVAIASRRQTQRRPMSVGCSGQCIMSANSGMAQPLW